MEWTLDPSVSMTKRSWFPLRELDQTIWPLTFSPMLVIASFSSALGFSLLPVGAAPPMLAQPRPAEASSNIPKNARPSPRAAVTRDSFPVCLVIGGSLLALTVGPDRRRSIAGRLPGENSGRIRRARPAADSRARAWPVRDPDRRR